MKSQCSLWIHRRMRTCVFTDISQELCSGSQEARHAENSSLLFPNLKETLIKSGMNRGHIFSSLFTKLTRI